MRKLIVLAFVLSTAACGSKKAPQSPNNTATEMTPANGSADAEAAGSAAPAGPATGGEGGTMNSSDPCEGGQ